MSSQKNIESAAETRRSRGRKGRLSPVATSLLAIIAFVASLSLAADHWMNNTVKVRAEVTGTKLMSVAEILRLARVPDTSVLADIDLMSVKRRIEANPVVREAVLRRNPPSTLEIEIRERTPIAVLLNVGARDWLIDADGYILPSVPSVSIDALPVLTGATNLQRVAPGQHLKNRRLLQVLRLLQQMHDADAEILHLFSEASLDGRNDVTLYTLEAGVPVLVDPSARITDVIKIFRAYWEDVAMQHDVRGLEYIDLRFKEQVVVRWVPGAGPAPRSTVIDTTAILPD